MRYWESQEEEERKAKEECITCGKKGHDKKSCPHELCLACGALDQHSTRECRQGVNCFRCGGRGHKSADCTQPRRNTSSSNLNGFGRRNGWAKECNQCGSVNHADSVCPNLFRIYWYNDQEEYERERLKKWKEFGAAEVLAMQKKGNNKPISTKASNAKRNYFDAFSYRSSSEGESESDSEDENHASGSKITKEHSDLISSGPPSDWDPAQRWCYNCAGKGHWGDDCPVPRCNPIRSNGDPSIYSDILADSGPFSGHFTSKREMHRQTEDFDSISVIEDHSGTLVEQSQQPKSQHNSRSRRSEKRSRDEDPFPKREKGKGGHGGRFSKKNHERKLESSIQKRSSLQDRLSDRTIDHTRPSHRRRKRKS